MEIAPFAPTVIRLFKGPLYDDQRKEWSELLLHIEGLRRYLAKIGIEVVLNENEGFAYLRQQQGEEISLPSLLSRRKLSWEVTLLCVLLRQKLDEFDLKDTDSRKLFLSKDELKAEIELFFEEENNRSRMLDKLEAYLKRVVDLGYLKPVKASVLQDDTQQKYEVKRILKARFDSDTLSRILAKIKNLHGPAANDI